jgi:hypothetical protein
MMRRLAAIVAVLVILLAFTYAAVRRQTTALRDAVSGRGTTTVTHSLVVEKVQAVAKLVTSETTIRDVVVYRNTWYGSTKRSLVVVTGRLLAGIDMKKGSDVRVDEATKTIRITLPRASVMALEITDMRTYDESGGLWNPFTPADRDAIHRLARGQILRSANELDVIGHAERSASELLSRLFTVDGYTATVMFATELETAGDG